MPRKYTKKSDYWNNISKKETVAELPAKWADLEIEDIALASDITVRNRIGGATTLAPTNLKERFRHLSEGLLPYETSGSVVNIHDTVELCQKAYANVSIFRNTIDGMTEFSTLPIHVKMKDKRAKAFIEKWMKHIKLKKFQEQFFRELYRSGNIPIFRLRGKFKSDSFTGLKSIFRNAKNELTVGYTILNPSHIGVMNQGYGDRAFVKLLSQYEIEEMKQSRDNNAKERLEALPDAVKRQIKTGVVQTRIYTDIDKKDLTMIFYNKQDYEYMAIPMGFSVLDDIEWKLSLKDMDKKLAKAVDRVILLITMGDEENGVNPKNHKAIKDIMKSPSAGRVIIADWTTNAKFVVPDLKQMLGPEKYQIVNEDIRNGLQNILVGEEKFANQFIKTKVFLERLNKGQEIFIDEFLIPEVTELCEAFGIKEIPHFEFEKINLEDRNVANKTFTRLMELNILTPDLGIKAMETGLLPDHDELIEDQKKMKKFKEDGLFERVPQKDGDKNSHDDGRPEGTTGTKQDTKNVGIQTSASLEKEGKGLFALSDIRGIMKKSEDLMKFAEAEIKTITGMKKLKAPQKKLVEEISVATMENSEMPEWQNTLKQALASQTLPEVSQTTEEIEKISKELEIDIYAASLLYHSTKL